VPAAAVIQTVWALSGLAGCKSCWDDLFITEKCALKSKFKKHRLLKIDLKKLASDCKVKRFELKGRLIELSM